MSSSRKHKSQFTTEQILEDFQEYQDSISSEESCVGEHWWTTNLRGVSHYTCLLEDCQEPVNDHRKFCSKEHAIRYEYNYNNQARKAKRLARRKKRKERKEKRKEIGRPRNVCLVSGIECRMYTEANKCLCENCKNLMKKPRRWMT